VRLLDSPCVSSQTRKVRRIGQLLSTTAVTSNPNSPSVLITDLGFGWERRNRETVIGAGSDETTGSMQLIVREVGVPFHVLLLLPVPRGSECQNEAPK